MALLRKLDMYVTRSRLMGGESSDPVAHTMQWSDKDYSLRAVSAILNLITPFTHNIMLAYQNLAFLVLPDNSQQPQRSTPNPKPMMVHWRT